MVHNVPILTSVLKFIISDERNQNVINYNDSMMDVGLKAQALYDYQAGTYSSTALMYDVFAAKFEYVVS